MANRTNTQLPKVPVPQPPKMDWFSKQRLWGYAFLVLAFLLAIAFIYQMEYGRKPKENRICIQVVTPARNQETGEVRNFPTPCDVPEGWEVIQAQGDDTTTQTGNSGNEMEICIQVITPARHKQTGEIRDFPTPCHVPNEWEPI